MFCDLISSFSFVTIVNDYFWQMWHHTSLIELPIVIYKSSFFFFFFFFLLSPFLGRNPNLTAARRGMGDGTSVDGE